MDNEEKLKKELKKQPIQSLNLKLKPEPRYEQLKKLLKSAKEKVLRSINNVVEYALDNFQELYNGITNSSIKNEDNFNEDLKLDETLVFHEIIAKAKKDGDTKEVILNHPPIHENMIGSSLVVDIEPPKIDSIIKNLVENLNESNNTVIKTEHKYENIKKDDSENDSNKLKHYNKKEIKNESNSLPTHSSYSFPKLNPTLSYQKHNDKKKDKPIDIEKRNPIINIEATIESMRNRILLNQAKNPIILEEQNYETVLKPQEPIFIIRNINTVLGNVSAIRNNIVSTSQYIPDSVEDQFGVEQRKIKSRLK